MNYKRLTMYSRLMRFDKPIGILLLLWPTLIALWIAGQGKPDPFVVVIFVLGVIVMRSAGCVVNDLADRKFDGHVKRTQNRPLVVGAITPSQAMGLFLLLLILALVLVLQLNTLTLGLSFVGLLLVGIYPFMKRYTHLPQIVLGAAYGWAVPMAFAAMNNTVPKEAILLYVATLCWVIVFDTIYGMVDREDDIRIGVKSTAILFGKADCWMISLLQGVALFLFVKLGLSLGLGVAYFVGLMLASIFVLYQQYLIKDRVPERCFQAFLNNNFFGAFLFGGLAVDYLM